VIELVKTYNSDTPASTTAQSYHGNQSGLYVFGRNSGISIIGGNGENNHIVFGNTSAAAFARIYTDNGTTAVGGNMYFNVGTDTTRMTITTGGNVVINPSGASSLAAAQFVNKQRSDTVSPALNGMVNMSGSNSSFLMIYYNGSEHIITASYYTGGDGGVYKPMAFQTSDTERFRITNGGNILMGTTSDNGERLYVSGSIRATGTITANSDITLKKNLLKIENALEKVEQINGYTYELKEDDSKRHAGVIAQEIQTVLPEIVNKGNDGILGVEYGNISALLIEAIKEQQTQINELKALLNK